MAEDPDPGAKIRRTLREVFSSRPWLAVSDVEQGAAATATALSDLGATEILAVGVNKGVGDIDPGLKMLRFDRPPVDEMMDSIRQADRLLRNPPKSILEEIDRWDPDQRARSIVDFLFAEGNICGRATFGARERRWEALEDKTMLSTLAGAARLDNTVGQVVSLNDSDAVLNAHKKLASELGTVWAVDNAAGWHGGGHGTFWIGDEQAAHRHRESLLAQHGTIRVMPFIEGIPCSIHGMVHKGEAIAFRPMELLTYRDHAEHQIIYAKAASLWDPAETDREAMRRAARLIGDELHRRVDYRGVFTLDGIMSQNGFVPTEVNTRFGGALPPTVKGADREAINLNLLNLAVIEGLAEDLDAGMLESWITEALDRHRWARGMFQTLIRPTDEKTITIGRGPDGSLHPVPDDADDPVGTIAWGPRGTGGLMFVNAATTLTTGPSSAPAILELAQCASHALGADLPLLEPAREVR
jgi:hypothetical protein